MAGSTALFAADDIMARLAAAEASVARLQAQVHSLEKNGSNPHAMQRIADLEDAVLHLSADMDRKIDDVYHSATCRGGCAQCVGR